MWRSCLLMLLAAVWGASSFEDTSPFFYVSTTDSSKATSEIPQLVITDAVLRNLQPRLSKCSSDTYIIFVQPNVNAADYEARDAVPYLKESMGLGKGQNVKTKASFGVSDVLGALDTDVLEEYLRNTCRAEVMNVDASSLFMGLLVSFLLLAILAAAMSALASLQVSYGAFEKEMGPAAAAAGHAQKKVL
ncbi:MAG: hypothetical protein M1826_001016 [Phylliscum demangeonii]|nr:MAG: hypothetical protein M1826_001016 [Phylliscum demangeonii]